MDSNNHNSSCNFSELLVSYLYGEIGEHEKLRFESHISNCGVCGDEIAAFGGVRSSVQTWRETEFAKLSTPVIELPRLNAEKATILSTEENAAVAAASRSSWLGSLRELFSLSPKWSGAATAFAALAICAGLVYVAVSSFLPNGSERNVAGTNQNTSVVPSPTVADRSETTFAKTETKDTQPDELPQPEVKKDKKRNLPKSVQQAPEKSVVAASGKADVKAVKITVAPRLVNKEKLPTQAKNPARQADIEFTTTRVEEEDKSLRLSDLFDEVSMK
ncbi:MAG: hypothetical protein M3384_05725 [Acidobacteriota bacterium]|nr:hypothetical protein [Acidobacteriota bacterium]